MTKEVFPGTCRGVRRGERLTNGCGKRCNAFTLIELVLVVGIITVLAGLVLSTVSYARKKGAFARAETEIAAMSAAIENYKADNGIYPTNPDTNALNAQTLGNPCGYRAASLYLYEQLSGDVSANFQPTARSYFTFKPNMLGTSPTTTIDSCGNTLTPATVSYIRDPFGNIYGYSTIDNPVANPIPTPGYNPTFDLWSTAGLSTSVPSAADQNHWIKNW
jgi:prepilin-type N-terminal cleavage/methylation domain-containing protein